MENSIEFFLNTHLEWSLSHQDLVITSGFDTYVVKALMDVQLSKVSCSVQLQNKLEDEG